MKSTFNIMKDKKIFLKISLPINNYQLTKRNTESNLRVIGSRDWIQRRTQEEMETSTNSTSRVGCRFADPHRKKEPQDARELRWQAHTAHQSERPTHSEARYSLGLSMLKCFKSGDLGNLWLSGKERLRLQVMTRTHL